MAAPIINAPGYAAVPLPNAPFDPFDVTTWSTFIDQEDPRMISFDLRCELESAYDVHPYSARARQAVVKSLLLWATMSRAQRQLIAWNNENNIKLGQNLVQHLLDITAELNGINTDEIHAALQAEKHPFLKKMHEAMQSRRPSEGEWRGRWERAAIEAPRRSTTAISPTPHREPSAIAPQYGTTTHVESLAREESHVAGRMIAHDALPTRTAPEDARERWPQPTPLRGDGAMDGGERRAAPPAYPPRSTKEAQPIEVADVAPTLAPSMPPSSVSVAKEDGTKAPAPPHAAEGPAVPQQRATAAPPPAPAPLPPTTRESLVHKVAPAPVAAPEAPATSAPASTTAWRSAAPPQAPPPSYQPPAASASKVTPTASKPTPPAAKPTPPAAKAPPPSAKAPAPAVKAPPPAMKAPPPAAKAPPPAVKAPPPAVKAPPPAPAAKSLPVAAVQKKHYTYSDSEESVSSASAAGEERGVDAPATVANGAPPEAGGVIGDEELLRFGDNGPEDLLQACLSDLSTDPDGVSAWFERKLAVTRADRAIPLDIAAPAALSLNKIKMRMEPRVLKRLDQLFAYLSVDAAEDLLPHNEAAAFLSTADVDQLAAANLIRPLKKHSGPDTVIAFSVVDRAEQTPTRRFLSWPCGSSRHAMENGYQPHIPLHHISSYLDAANSAAGCVESLTSAFDQVELPQSIQERFVFTDAANRCWCLTRLPMAHTVAAEVVHILLSTLCGHPSYALQSYTAAPAVRIDVWVRTVRFFGEQRDVVQSRDKFRAACKDSGAALRPSTGAANAAYDFVGVHYDHAAHTVSVEPQMIGRLAAPRRSVTTRDLEQQYTRLLFSASVLNIAVSKFYKLLRTVCYRLSQALEDADSLLSEKPLPVDAFAQLEKWHKEVAQNVSRPVQKESLPNMTLFVELSAESWFAVLIGEETQETWNTGGSLEDMLGSKIACASITKAVECFQPCIEKGAHVKIMILGGNGMGRNEKVICRNEPKEVIADCIRTHLVTRTFSFEVEYADLAEGRGNVASVALRKPAGKGKWS